MFTGIVEELGRLRERNGSRFTFEAVGVLDDAEIGASIAVNGCCLTVVDRGQGWWAADVVAETLDRTTLGGLTAGEPVNLERPVRLADRLSGHLVQGHVDGVGQVTAPAPDLAVRAPAALHRYLVEKGSVAVDGCSLTVARVDDDGFAVAIVPHTAAVTTLGRRKPGDRVNLEVDVVAKYVEKLVTGS
ncbi:MAG: riboflavin synthase [Actinomycetota bacterium]|nr:riboflavin synthase [Actinomycetota bacterium]